MCTQSIRVKFNFCEADNINLPELMDNGCYSLSVETTRRILNAYTLWLWPQMAVAKIEKQLGKWVFQTLIPHAGHCFLWSMAWLLFVAFSGGQLLSKGKMPLWYSGMRSTPFVNPVTFLGFTSNTILANCFFRLLCPLSPESCKAFRTIVLLCHVSEVTFWKCICLGKNHLWDFPTDFSIQIQIMWICGWLFYFISSLPKGFGISYYHKILNGE